MNCQSRSRALSLPPSRAALFSLSSSVLSVVGFLLIAAPSLAAQPPAAAVSAYNTYIATVESRFAQQHRSPDTFLAAVETSPQNAARLRQGELIIEQLTPPASPSFAGTMLHHWRGTAFAAGATAADFERLMQTFSAYPQHYAPQVLQVRILAQTPYQFQIQMRVRQRHILTVVLDTTYDVAFARLDSQHGFSTSRSTRIAEIDSPGTPSERAFSPAEDHGFLWRQNTYWSYEERDGGLYMQVESVSLSRSIPRGLGWAVGPFVQSIPRDSLEFTLRSTCNALHK